MTMSNQQLAIKILNDYPIATEIVRDWFIKKMKQNLEEDMVADDFKEFMIRKGVPDDTLAIMLDQNPRAFFDVLDENNLIIEIIHAGNRLFYFTINDQSVLDSGDFEGRVPCERAAVIAAFERLS
jgi:hypothetical protein